MKSFINLPFQWINRYPAPLLALLGLTMSFLPMWLHGEQLVPGDRGDGRLNLYFLEHGWRWLSGGELQQSLWDAPFFFPAANTMAYSDILLGIAPAYWLGRALGLDEFASLRGLYLILYLLNFGTMYWLLYKVCRFGALGAAVGAFFFAFSPPRNYAMGHIQTAGTFYIPLFWGCLVESFRNGKVNRWKRAGWISAVAACGVGLFYAGFYIFFFTALGSGIFVMALLLTRQGRQDILNYCRNNWLVLALGGGAAVLLILPGAMHYQAAAQMFSGNRPFTAIEFPSITTFLNTAGYFYKTVLPASMAKTVNARMGIGIVTLLLVWYAIFRMGRCSVYYRCLGATAVALLLLSLNWTAPWLWRVVFEVIPGAPAIRIVPRVILVLLVIYGFAAAYLFDLLPSRWQQILLLIIVFEFAGVGYIKWDATAERHRMAKLEQAVPPGREPLLLINNGEKIPYHTDLDAMWLGLKTDRPVINGYSGNHPPGYPAIRTLQPGTLNALPSPKILVVLEDTEGIVMTKSLCR
jgi:hypothetical protein